MATPASNETAANARFGGSALIRWTNNAFFEGSYSPKTCVCESIFLFTAHDGDQRKVTSSEIYLLGLAVKTGDLCCAYWNASCTYLCPGIVKDVRDSNGQKQLFVQFDDGDKGWIPAQWAHRRITLKASSAVQETMFHGVDLSQQQIKLVKSTECGANILHLQEMYSLHKSKQPTELDISFSYNLVSHDAQNGAVVRPAYTPRFLSGTVCGHHMRVADDSLKLLLKELVCIARTQTAVDKFCGASAGQSISIEYKAGVRRLRIKPATIVSQTVGNIYVIDDVEFELEYDCGQAEPSELEKLYIKYCETEWIPRKAKEPEHPFYLLKQVIIAQQLVKYAVAQGASFGFAAWQPIFLDRCADLVFPVTEVRTKVFAAVESGVGAAALCNFEKAYKGSDIAVLIKKTNQGYSPPQIVYDLNPNSVQGMEAFGEMFEKKPTCPDGGVILAAEVAQAEKELTEASKKFLSSVVSLFPIPDSVTLTQYVKSVATKAKTAAEAAKNQDRKVVEKEMKAVMIETAGIAASKISNGLYDYCAVVYHGAHAFGKAQQLDFAFRVQQLIKGGMSEYEAIDHVLQDEL